MNNMIRCAIYDRVSTDNQVENGISLDAQRKALTDYANAHNYKIVGYYTDEGITARKKMQNRKDLTRLLNDVKENKIDLILVTKLDRWFRNIKDYHNTQAVLEAHNCNWKTIYEDYDTSSSNGRFAINIMLSVNENECDRDSDRIKEAFRYKIALGEIINPSMVYWGYRVENKHLVFDEEKKPIVNDIYDTFLKNHSKHTTYRYCLEKYGDLFSYQTFKHFFDIELYKGKYHFNDNFCPAYLTEEQWDRIQQVNKRNIKVYNSSKDKKEYLFTGLVRCPLCGRAMSGGYTLQKSGKANLYYRCWKHRVDRSCEYNKMITEIALERYLKQNILFEIGRMQERIKMHEKIIAQKKFDAAKLKSELERLNNMFLKGRITEEKYDQEYLRIQTIFEEEKQKSLPVPTDFQDLIAFFSSDWFSIYDQLDRGHQRSFWHNMIDKIEFTEDKTVKSISFHSKFVLFVP